MMRPTGIAIAAALLGVPFAAAQTPEIPATPAPAEKLLYARTFDVTDEFSYRASVERPDVSEGTIVILEVDPALVYPRQVAEPVLYVGDHPAQRLNQGFPEGIVIAFVPSKVDLKVTPVWFGTPELPERVDRETARRELELALAQGIVPFPAAVVDAAETAGGLSLRVEDVTRFDQAARSLYEEWILPRRENASVRD